MFSAVQSKEVEDRALKLLNKIVCGGNEYLTTHIEKNGTEWKFSLAITEKRIKNILKLTSSCYVSVYGQVFHGIKEIEKYCKEQIETSSPYILKRCFRLPYTDEDNHLEQRFAKNYLLCKDKHEADSFIQTFIGIGNISVLTLDSIPTPEEFPPLICYVDQCWYMLLSYREGVDY